MRFEYSINILLLKASEIKPGKNLLFSQKKVKSMKNNYEVT